MKEKQIKVKIIVKDSKNSMPCDDGMLRQGKGNRNEQEC